MSDSTLNGCVADAHGAGGDEQPIALGASGDVVRLVQPLGLQLPIGRVEVHDVVGLVLDPRQLHFLDRAPVGHGGPGRRVGGGKLRQIDAARR